MKKVLLTLTVAAGLAMTSCGGMDMCSCAEKHNEMREEMKAAGEDEAKLKAVEEKFAADKKACEEVGKALEAEMKDMSDEDKMKKFEEMAKDCPAMGEGH